jgi:predicted GIY-YIG superfamily endonuclease
LEKRLAEHTSGATGGYTATRRPLKLQFSQEFLTREEALIAERQIKGWSRKKKMALMAGDWQKISMLAQSRNLGHPSILRQAQGQGERD